MLRPILYRRALEGLNRFVTTRATCANAYKIPKQTEEMDLHFFEVVFILVEKTEGGDSDKTRR
jgi:hypothetical protein